MKALMEGMKEVHNYWILMKQNIFVLISKRKKDVNCTGLICFILTNLFIQRFYFLYVLLSLSNCWFAHLIFQDDNQSIFLRTMPWLIQFEMVSTQIYVLLCHLLDIVLKFTMVFPKGFWKTTVCMPLSPSRVSFLSTGGTVARIIC